MTPIDQRVLASLNDSTIAQALLGTKPLAAAIATVFPRATLEACICLVTMLVGEFRDHGHSPEGLHALIDRIWDDRLVLARHPPPPTMEIARVLSTKPLP
jgi:hypothetical protein